MGGQQDSAPCGPSEIWVDGTAMLLNIGGHGARGKELFSVSSTSATKYPSL